MLENKVTTTTTFLMYCVNLMLMVMTPEDQIWSYISQPCVKTYRNSFMYMGGKLWNDLPEFVQHSTSTESFKQNNIMYKLIISS